MKQRMKRTLAMILALSLGLIACAIAEEETEREDLRRLRLGSSVYEVMIDDDFVRGDLTAADIAAGQVACLQNDETGLDMDVFQVSKEGLTQELPHYTLETANAEELVQVVWPNDEINDICVGWYWATKTRNDEVFDTATYILDSGDSYVKLVFWTPNDAAGMQVLDIVYSLQYIALKEIYLGTSHFTLAVPDDYQLGEITEEDIADDQVAYWYSEASLMDFDVYQFSKEGQPETIGEYAEAEAATYPAVSELVTDGEINLVPVAWYRAVDECDEGEYDTITYVMEDGDDYLEVVFWLDGPTAEAEADFIIHNLINESLAEADGEEVAE